MGRKRIIGNHGITSGQQLREKINNEFFETQFRGKNNNSNSRHFNRNNANNLRVVLGANNWLSYNFSGYHYWPHSLYDFNNNNVQIRYKIKSKHEPEDNPKPECNFKIGESLNYFSLEIKMLNPMFLNYRDKVGDCITDKELKILHDNYLETNKDEDPSNLWLYFDSYLFLGCVIGIINKIGIPSIYYFTKNF